MRPPATPVIRTPGPMSDQAFDYQNAAYAQLLYEEYAKNPEAVPEEWRSFFTRGPEATSASGLLVPETLEGPTPPPSAGAAPSAAPAAAATAPPLAQPDPAGPAAQAATQAELDRLRWLVPMVARATSLVQAYRDHGHMLAQIDPLGSDAPGHPQLDPSFFGMRMDELDRIPAFFIMDGAEEGETVAGALLRLQHTYSRWIGYEFEHLEDPAKVRWLWEYTEKGIHEGSLTDDDRRWLFERLTYVEGLEQFLHRTYLGQKRFSLEGNDLLVPMLDTVLEEAAKTGGKKAVIGMAHRGRINVLTHILGVSYEDLIAEFEGVGNAEGALHVPGSGDVKYHHGAESTYRLRNGEEIEVVLAPNPSHLEYVNPVISGMARAWQFQEGDENTQELDAVVPIMIHGDAAFAAEGVVAETLNMARLDGYHVGGAIHIICNNQIGFTTTPEEGRSTRYSSDLAKGYDFPIIHVNADHPEACMAAVRLAMAYRAEYHDDIVIDLIGYRRHGHNEGDEPAYTSPELYKRISAHPTAWTLMKERQIRKGLATEETADALWQQAIDRFRAAQDTVKARPPIDPDAPDAKVHEEVVDPETAVPLETLQRINAATVSVPEGFTIHPKLLRQLKRRMDGFEVDTKLDWAYAEALAFGSLLEEGVVVRLTGQDAQRGTFSHRHLVLHDAETGQVHTPLSTVEGGRLEVFNSPLTEAAVMGFEYGYSVASKHDLVLWEGQFGDFVNVAQVAIDQFIAAGLQKWGQVSNLTLLLPHGYEGQGPEHSSARLGRFLQLCAEDNMRVVYPSTPAQYFHMLRRQSHARPERAKIVMTPKSLLRLPAASSLASELVEGRFHPVLDDPDTADRREEITRLVLCSGKVYYDIQGSKRRDEATSVAVGRIEQLYPFPKAEVAEVVARYPNLREVVWAQEEPRNMGALTFVVPRLRGALPREIALRHVSRPDRASPAEGKPSVHLAAQTRVVEGALGLR